MQARVRDAESASLVFEYKGNPTSPEAVTNFWQTFIRISIERSGEDIDVPEVPAVDRSQEDLEALRKERRMMVYNPGLSYAVLGKIFPDMRNDRVQENSPIKDERSEAGWVDVEMDIYAPNRNTTQGYLEELFKSQGRYGMRESTYIWAGQASNVLTGKYFDQGSTYSRLLSSSIDGHVVLAYFLPHGGLYVGWELVPMVYPFVKTPKYVS